MDLPKGIFITGTDTGVGKTVVTASLAACLQSNGYSVAVIKPVQTGTELPGLTDIQFVYRVLQRPYTMDEVCFCRLPQPLSPMTASRLSGQEVDVTGIEQKLRSFTDHYDFVIAEGAGGVLVPVADGYYIIDLISNTGFSALIVSRPGLGTINHTLLTARALEDAGIDLLGFVISGFPRDPGDAEKNNPGDIESTGGIELRGVIPNLNGLSVEEGVAGNLKDISRAFFVPELGGTFDKEGFLKELTSADK